MLRQIAQWTMYAGMAIAMVSGATWPRPSWGGWALGLLVIGAGIVLRRRAGAPSLEEEHGAAQTGEKPARTGTLEDALGQFADETRELATQAETLELEAIKKRAEELIWIGPERLGQSQEAIAAKVGFATYAEIMAPLATAERWLYRAWSAAADGHRPEAVSSIKTASTFAGEAAQLGRGKLSAQAGSAPPYRSPMGERGHG